MVKAPEGTSQPGVGWPTAPGASLPAFPRVGGSRVRNPPDLMPLVLEMYARMDHLDKVNMFQQRMLNVGRQDLHAMGHILQDVLRVTGIDLGDPRLGHQCTGEH